MNVNITVKESATSLYPGFFRQFRKTAEKGNREAARFLMERCRENVSELWPPASKEGEYPRLRTGRGQDSIQVVRVDRGPTQPADYDVFVAPPYLHMAYLELGEALAWDRKTTITRQWLFPTEEEHEAELFALRMRQF
jgi:hypothetical protein